MWDWLGWCRAGISLVHIVLRYFSVLHLVGRRGADMSLHLCGPDLVDAHCSFVPKRFCILDLVGRRLC